MAYNPNNPTAGTTTSGSTTYGTEATRQSNLGSTSGMGTSSTSGLGSTSTSSGSGMGSTGSVDMTEGTTATGAGVTRAIGERLEKAGEYLEGKGKAAFISERLHGAGKYLQDTEPRQIFRTVDEAICAHPYRGMVIGLGIGWLVGRFLSGRGD